MDKVDLAGNFPSGFCTACLERMATNTLYGAIRLQRGRTILHAYCEHAQAGAALVLRPEWPARWTITMPIDVLDWQKLLQMKAAALASYLERSPPPPVQTSVHAAPETLQ